MKEILIVEIPRFQNSKGDQKYKVLYRKKNRVSYMYNVYIVMNSKST